MLKLPSSLPAQSPKAKKGAWLGPHPKFPVFPKAFWEFWEPSRGGQASQPLTSSSATWPGPLPEPVGGRPCFYFWTHVPQTPLLAQQSVAGRGDFGEEALSASSHL